GRNIFGAITFYQCDASLFQECRHRGINIIVRTGDFEAALLQRRRNRAHGRSANPEKMKFLRRFFHADSLRRPGRKGNHGLHGFHRSGEQRFLISQRNRTPLHYKDWTERMSDSRTGKIGQIHVFLPVLSVVSYFFSNTSTASHASSGGCCSYSSVRSRYILANKSSG